MPCSWCHTRHPCCRERHNGKQIIVRYYNNQGILAVVTKDPFANHPWKIKIWFRKFSGEDWEWRGTFHITAQTFITYILSVFWKQNGGGGWAYSPFPGSHAYTGIWFQNLDWIVFEQEGILFVSNLQWHELFVLAISFKGPLAPHMVALKNI